MYQVLVREHSIKPVYKERYHNEQDELCEIIDGIKQESLYEIINGVKVVKGAPTITHQIIVTKIHWLIHTYVQTHGLGLVCNSQTRIIFSHLHRLVPDASFISNEKLSILTGEEITVTPEWILEVESSNREHDRKVKYNAYEKYGVEEYWLVNPSEEEITVYVLENGEFEIFCHTVGTGLVRSKLFPDLVINTEEIFKKEIDVTQVSLFGMGKEQGKEQGIEIGKEQGIEQGIEIGKAEEKNEIARSMLADGIDPHTIQKFTKLTIEEINQL